MMNSRMCFPKTAVSVVALWLVVAGVAAQPARAQTFKVLHTFHKSNGYGPAGVLVRDALGNLYGTTAGGGHGMCNGYPCGTAFKLDKSGKQVWLHTFNGKDGMNPYAGLMWDGSGNLYGTTELGGDMTCKNNSLGCGTVFKLDKTGKETVLYKFTGMPDGVYPDSPVVEDAAGNLYGTTELGGPSAAGTVFKVDKNGNETILHSFTGSDGCIPVGVILDSAGNLYGAAESGGYNCSGGDGEIFELDTVGNFTVLHAFIGSDDGSHPDSILLLGADGNLYGTTGYGGNMDCGGGSGCGVVFELSANGETVLYSFCSLSNCADGQYPGGGPLVRDSNGNLYGTTDEGGTDRNCNGNTCGVAFKLDTTGKETVLHSFSDGTDGALPEVGLIVDHSGSLYGVALQGGDINCKINGIPGCGVVFKITP